MKKLINLFYVAIGLVVACFPVLIAWCMAYGTGILQWWFVSFGVLLSGPVGLTMVSLRLANSNEDF